MTLMFVLWQAAHATEPIPAPPRTVDLRPGVIYEEPTEGNGVRTPRTFVAGELTTHIPGAMWFRATGGTAKRRVTSTTLAKLFNENGVSAEHSRWHDTRLTGELCWESPLVGPGFAVRIGGSGTYNNDGLGNFIRANQNLSDVGALHVERSLTLGPSAAVGVNIVTPKVQLQPTLAVAHERPVAAKTMWDDELRNSVEDRYGIDLPTGFVRPLTSYELRVGVAVRGVSGELLYRLEDQRISAYDEAVNASRASRDLVASRVTMPAFEARLGVRLGRANADGSASSDELPEGIQPIGVEELDEIFAQVEAIRREREKLHKALSSAYRAVDSLAQELGADSVADLIAGIKQGDIQVGVQLILEGGKPKVVPTAALTGETEEIVGAFDALNKAISAVQASVPAMVKSAKRLVDETKGLVQSGPDVLKKARIPPMKIPAALKALKHNIAVTAAVPQELQTTVDASIKLLKLITPA